MTSAREFLNTPTITPHVIIFLASLFFPENKRNIGNGFHALPKITYQEIAISPRGSIN